MLYSYRLYDKLENSSYFKEKNNVASNTAVNARRDAALVEATEKQFTR